MTPRATFKLSRLREIGWQRWDPIGLSGLENTPDDEYDSYLLQAAGRLWNGVSKEDVAEYLVEIEIEHMELCNAPGGRHRAREAVDALSAYVEEVRREIRRID